MKRIAYLATSLDGFIARADGAVDWLEPFPSDAFGIDRFLSGIDTLVMGRTTYEQMRTFGAWPYGERRTLVVTSRALADAPPGVEAVAAEFAEFDRTLEQGARGDVWIFGGARLIGGMLDARLIDRLELFVVPVVLGRGLGLFAHAHRPVELSLEVAEAAPMGVVRLVYDVGRGG